MAQIHRFGDAVAVSVTGVTRYMTTKQARQMAEAILAQVNSIETQKFSQSTVPTWTGSDFNNYEIEYALECEKRNAR
jgi:hypothetical protein